MAGFPTGQALRDIFSSLKDYFLPQPIEPVEVPVAPRNTRPLSEPEISQLRREQANAIDKYFDGELDKKIFDELNNKSRSLQWMPDIDPESPLWQETRAYYAELLKSQKISDVLDDHFEEIQKILINPQAWSNEVQAVRDQQSRDYYENIGPNGRFDGQLDNLATKMTMVHFGLPVAPMTLNNIMVLTPEWRDSEDDEEDPAPSPPRTQRIVYSEKPLEFLDSYFERAFGYQIIRRPRVSMRGGAGSIEELDFADSSDCEWGSTINMRGGAGKEPALKGLYLDLLGPGPVHQSRRTHLTSEEFLASAHELLNFPDAADLRFNIDIYRQTDPRKIDIPLLIAIPIYSNENFSAKWPVIEKTIGKVDHNQLTIIIEAERFVGEHTPEFYEDLGRLAREFPDESRKVSRHKIYSYFGQRETTPTYLDFKHGVTKLLNIDPRSNWSFLVDVHLQDRILSPMHFTRMQYRNDFLALRDEYLLGAASNNARVFVRNVSGYAPAQLNVVEPAADNIQIVRLTNQQNRTESYWKVPLDLSEKPHPYCINHLQPAFVRAFTAIFGRDRPCRNVNLFTSQDGKDFQHYIGTGGMEVTSQTWNWLKERIEEQKRNPPAPDANPLSCQLTLTVPILDHGIRPEQALSLHLIGDDHQIDMVFKRWEFQQIYDYILERLRKVHRHRRNSTFPDGSAIAMWFSATEREENYPSVIMQVHSHDSDAEKRRKLTEAFAGRIQTFSNIWFRPEYRVFTIQDHKEPARIWQWNTTDEQHNTSLENFRANVSQMYDDWDPVLDSNFVLMGPHKNHVFGVDRRTTESYWRRYIFDWFTETDIYVERRGTRTFIQPDTIPWGYRHTRQLPPPAPVDLNPVPVAPVVDTFQQPRINKTRLILATAEKTITPKWETWMTDQHRKDALQRRSYIQDQSVIEPGFDPSAPTYGPSKELSLGVSIQTPSVYTQRLTPTDILQLAEENQKLRNGLLERTYNCSVCSVTLAGYEHAEIQTHYAQHLIQLQREGQCPLCERESWSIMTMEQKKEHLETHQVEADTAMIRNFWNSIECPLCDAKLSGFTAEQVIRHMADHLPGIVEFCDKCGLRTAICNHAELVHHRYVCLDKPDRGPLDLAPSFCRDCGQNRTAEDEAERGSHVINCTAKNRVQGEKFCTKCGIDKSAWGSDEIKNHDDHCTSPQGLPKKYCLRCGTKLFGANEAQLDDHRVYCSIRTKEPENLKHRIEELQARTATLNRVAAKNAATLSWITKREGEIAESERALAERESHLPQEDRPLIPYAQDKENLGKCPWALYGCNFHTVGMSRAEIFQHMSSHFDPKQAHPFACPFPGCGKGIAVPGSNPGNNIPIEDHYRHRSYQGIADVIGVPKVFKDGSTRDVSKLKALLEHFERANAMNAQTLDRNLTPLPEPGQANFTALVASGGGAGSQKFGPNAQKTGYAFQASWISSEDEGIHHSIENDDLAHYQDDEDLFLLGDYEPEPEPEIIRKTPSKPKSSRPQPILPVSPTKRKASAPIPEEELSPPATRSTKRMRTAIQTPSVESESGEEEEEEEGSGLELEPEPEPELETETETEPEPEPKAKPVSRRPSTRTPRNISQSKPNFFNFEDEHEDEDVEEDLDVIWEEYEADTQENEVERLRG
ncbi:hypothetical protein sscle_02g016030 [Sclerotinia sclerotiorum 1980 UF-70]|uniref:C2H2-type domain-containing protein n=1 Tax=Sclerotinia sclerotiorum (strain ATCC 18683 / 1980 / Ss-1) TaxID=665079 RepID=A0A1D9PX02_SCLS1|nr:hypothetical protein sscle_02g016030 [Sclerotinia sclerotiorum 1980 UF-70]